MIKQSRRLVSCLIIIHVIGGRAMNQFRRFMYGRYGFDQYTSALVITSLLLSIVAAFTRLAPLFLLSYLPLIYAIYRVLSKNIAKRSKENLAYWKLTNTVRNKLKNLKLIFVGTKTHKYYRCSHCKQIIRVPRGKGKICITCPKCRAEFVKRT
jgi:ABC-type transport system involved in cytochrome bd biosynthesis fused ATPase/permease subunit